MNSLTILHPEDSIHVIKANKTDVHYYLFDEYEIHLNMIPTHTTQEWHYHHQIEEVILVTKGKMKCMWLEDGQKCEQVIYEKDLVQVKKSIHTFENDGDEDCEFVVFRLVLDGKNKREIIKNDKTVVKDL